MNKILLNPRISWLFMAVVFLFLSACQGGEGNGTATVRLSFDRSSSKTGVAKTSSAPAPSGITSVRIDVTGPEMDPLSTSVEVNSEAETVVRLEVPAGPARRFVVTAFDIEGIARYLGEETADLVPGASVNLTIEMVSLVISPSPTIQISPDPAVVAKDQTQTFSVTGIDPSQIQLEVTSDVGNDPERVGRIAANGAYTPPAAILTDGSTPIGNPIPVTVTASDKNTPTVRDSATVRLTTGSHLTFEKNQRVTPTSGSISTESSGQRSIAFHQGKVYAVWSNGFQILFSETVDGINWSTPPVEVRFNERGVAGPSLAVSSEGTVYVAYVDCTSCSAAPPTIQLANRPFSGGDFTSIPLDTGSSPQNPTVAVAPDGVAFVAWSDIAPNTTTGRDIYLQRVPDNQGSKRINTDNQNVSQDHPAISIAISGEIFLAWEDGRNKTTDIFATVLPKGANTFMPETQVNTADPDPFVVALRPSVAAGPQGTVYVAWEKDICGDGCTFLFFDTGKIGPTQLDFGVDKAVGPAVVDSRRQSDPSIAWDGRNDIYLSFEETFNTNNDGIFLAKTIDGGATFNFSRMDDDRSSTFVNKFSSSLAVDSAGRAFSIWTDGRFGGSVQPYDVFFAKGE